MVLNRARKSWPLSNLFRRSVHAADELVDLLLAVAPVTALGLSVPVALRDEATARRVELEGPEEVVRLLEGRADGVDLVDQLLHAVDAVLAKVRGEDVVIHQRNAALVNLAVATLVDQLLHRLQVRVAKRDVRCDVLEHVDDGLVDLQEHAVVELAEAEKLEDLARLRGELVDTDDTDAKDQLRVRLDEELAQRFGLATHRDQVLLSVSVLLFELLGVLLELRAACLARGAELCNLLLLLLHKLVIASDLLLDELRHGSSLGGEVAEDLEPFRHAT